MIDVPWADCDRCVEHELNGGFSLGMAIATVGIERGLSAPDMAVVYFADYHVNGHVLAVERIS